MVIYQNNEEYQYDMQYHNVPVYVPTKRKETKYRIQMRVKSPAFARLSDRYGASDWSATGIQSAALQYSVHNTEHITDRSNFI